MLEAAEAEMEERMKEDTKCGIGSCKSKKCTNISLFSFNLSAVVLFHVALFRFVHSIPKNILFDPKYVYNITEKLSLPGQGC